MFSKIIFISCALTAVFAGIVDYESHGLPSSYAQSNLESHHAHKVIIHDHPKYDFKYGVEDVHSGDFKTQAETRDGDEVKGFYSLVESDGSTRIVHYTADHHNGFKAVVEKAEHGVSHHEEPHLLHHH